MTRKERLMYWQGIINKQKESGLSGAAFCKYYETVEDLIQGLREYFWFYNNERPHQSLGGRTPAEVYFEGSELRKAA